MKIYCCECRREIEARLTDGVEIYPHRDDLGDVPFWKCDTCGNYVGCHYKTNRPTRPLGVIANDEIRNARKHIHVVLDLIWKNRNINRGDVYKMISSLIGYEYHTAEIRTIEEARKIYRIVRDISETAKAP